MATLEDDGNDPWTAFANEQMPVAVSRMRDALRTFYVRLVEETDRVARERYGSQGVSDRCGIAAQVLEQGRDPDAPSTFVLPFDLAVTKLIDHVTDSHWEYVPIIDEIVADDTLATERAQIEWAERLVRRLRPVGRG